MAIVSRLSTVARANELTKGIPHAWPSILGSIVKSILGFAAGTVGVI